MWCDSHARMLCRKGFAVAGVAHTLRLRWMNVWNDSLALRTAVTDHSTTVTTVMLAIDKGKRITTDFTGAVRGRGERSRETERERCTHLAALSGFHTGAT
jgi:hypothetical protein